MSQQFCTQCGAKLPDQGNFCPQCGAPIERAVAPPASPPPAQPSTQPSAQPPAQPVALPAEEPAVQAEKSDPQSAVSRTVLFGLVGVALAAVLAAVVYFVNFRPAGLESDCGATPCTVDQAAIPDVHDDEGIPYPDVARISVVEANARYADGTAVFVDVRDRDSYTAAHIPHAVWIPLTDLNARYAELPTDAQIITYCT